MNKPQTVENLYKYKFDWVPERLQTEIGHFNVFNLEDFAGKAGKPVPFSRRDYYKISLILGRTDIYYADKTLKIQKKGLLFSNPLLPYNIERKDGQSNGYVCIFTAAFFHQFGNLNKYAVFEPGGTPVFELNDQQAEAFEKVFEQMLKEIGTDYQHKYDVLRNLVFDIAHSAMKMTPATGISDHGTNASQRISLLLLELVERQYPIEDNRQRVQLRSASDFADRLGIHVNYLNKAVKETSGKTTSDIIGERVILEAKTLLKNTHWNVSEIAYSLGFNEVTNFNNFFKKKLNISPGQFRDI